MMLAAALVLTFTLSDYYIFNRIAEFGAFAAVQWIKKAGLLLVAGAVFFGNRRCADSARYIIPVAVIISFCTFGSFFDVTKPADSSAQEIYNSINLFMPKAAHITVPRRRNERRADRRRTKKCRLRRQYAATN